MNFYEDIEVGARECYGRYVVTREEVIAFAEKYDPQPFHLDDAAAAATHFERLSASGWHTAAMMMAMNVARWKDTETASLGSPGLDELRWLKPVYPGDILRVETEMLSKRRSASRPEMGLTKSRWTVINQNDEPVLSVIGNGMVRVRNPELPGT